MAREQARFTRRHLLAAAGLGGAAVAVGYGRFAVGDEFEEHVAATLGTSLALATRMTASARASMPSLEYDARAAGFLAATTFPSAALMPGRIRERAIRSLVEPMIPRSSENLAYLGLQPSARLACAGLLRG